jgi:phage-related protein/predicted XRE-type DNA-binding protein
MKADALVRQNKRVPAIFFCTDAGGEPVRDWLKGLSLEDRKRIGEDIKTVEFGWPIGMPVCKPLGDGIYEVRTALEYNRISRVLFYIDRKSRMVLLHAFIKKTQKTTDAALDLARTNRRKHSERVAMKVAKNGKRTDHSGSTFDSFLDEECIREEVEAVAIKRVLAWQLEQAMRKRQMTKKAMAEQLRTSRSQLDRLLDPKNVSVTLDTVARAARAVGKRLIIRVADVKARRA